MRDQFKFGDMVVYNCSIYGYLQAPQTAHSLNLREGWCLLWDFERNICFSVNEKECIKIR